jgi:hypothetical protein
VIDMTAPQELNRTFGQLSKTAHSVSGQWIRRALNHEQQRRSFGGHQLDQIRVDFTYVRVVDRLGVAHEGLHASVSPR